MTLQVGPLEVDALCGRVLVEGGEVKLRPMERRILVHLVSNPDRAVTREALAQILWGEDPSPDLRSIDTFVTRIRRALGRSGDCILTVRRVGYRFDPERLRP